MRASLVALAALSIACGGEASTTATGSATSNTSDSASATASDAPDAPATRATRWGGRIDLPTGALAFEVTFDTSNERAKITIPAQGVSGMELGDAKADDRSLKFTLKQPGGEAAQGKFVLERRGSEGTGTLSQNGGTFPVKMRVLEEGEPTEAVARPQTPRPPFPYDVREASYTSKDGTKLAGTLTLPKGPGKHPALVLVSGTGEQDRDSTLAGHKPFWLLADHLARRGVAVLRVDDRGVGGSRGSTADAGYDAKVDDVLAGMTWLASQPELDGAKIGLLGHSEGGIIGPLTAARATSPAVAFLILLAGPGVPMREFLLEQMEGTLRASGASAERIATAMASQRRIVDAVIAKKTDAELEVLVTEHLDALLRDQGKEASRAERAGLIRQNMAQVASPAMRDFIRAQPGPALEKVTCPVLALGGGKDLQVPGERNISAIREALTRGGNEDVTAEVFPELNHLFQTAKIGTTDEWGLIDTTMEPAVLEKIASWTASKAPR